MKIEVILERSPYRYVQVGLLRNGCPDYRIQKYNDIIERYEDIYTQGAQTHRLRSADFCEIPFVQSTLSPPTQAI